ncbi:MAG TPA: hypothetical protein PL000_18275 [Anaerolineales bacterium]|nr:hypothetical protein [Anaerolineales bacterium]
MTYPPFAPHELRIMAMMTPTATAVATSLSQTIFRDCVPPEQASLSFIEQVLAGMTAYPLSARDIALGAILEMVEEGKATRGEDIRRIILASERFR